MRCRWRTQGLPCWSFRGNILVCFGGPITLASFRSMLSTRNRNCDSDQKLQLRSDLHRVSLWNVACSISELNNLQESLDKSSKDETSYHCRDWEFWIVYSSEFPNILVESQCSQLIRPRRLWCKSCTLSGYAEAKNEETRVTTTWYSGDDKCDLHWFYIESTNLVGISVDNGGDGCERERWGKSILSAPIQSDIR